MSLPTTNIILLTFSHHSLLLPVHFDSCQLTKTRVNYFNSFGDFFPSHMGTVIFFRMYTSSRVFSFELLTWKKKWDLHLHEQGRILPEFFKREMSVLVLKNYWLTIIDFRWFFLNEKCYDRISQIKFNSHFTTKRVFLIDVCISIWILIFHHSKSARHISIEIKWSVAGYWTGYVS